MSSTPSQRFLLNFRDSDIYRFYLLERAVSAGVNIFAISNRHDENMESFQRILENNIRQYESISGVQYMTFRQFIYRRQRAAFANNVMRRSLRNWRSMRSYVTDLPRANARLVVDPYEYGYDDRRRVSLIPKPGREISGSWDQPGAFRMNRPFPRRVIRPIPILEVDNWAEARRITDEEVARDLFTQHMERERRRRVKRRREQDIFEPKPKR